jgi:hypothetical protein
LTSIRQQLPGQNYRSGQVKQLVTVTEQNQIQLQADERLTPDPMPKYGPELQPNINASSGHSRKQAIGR